MYLIILCIILSIGIRNESQISKETGNHNQIEHNHFKQNNNLLNSILSKTNTKQRKNQTDILPVRSLDATSGKPSSKVSGFISTWQTNLFSLSSNEYQIKLPLVADGTYDFNASWGDGSSNLITAYNQSAVTHNYSFLGTYTINITGTIIGWNFNDSGDKLKLIQISNWGPLRLGNSGYYFAGASNLVLTTKDALDLNGTTDLAGMFENCYAIGSSGDLNSWNVSQVTNMSNMFKISKIIYKEGLPYFNQLLNSWNVTQVTDMSGMFYAEPNFNLSLNSWDVLKVTEMSNMFYDTIFNQPLNTWNVSQVTNMSGMFAYSSFNQSLNSWNVSQVINMSSMFNDARNFNQTLDSWNVSQVINMSSMFSGTSFNQPLNSWNVSRVTDINGMFYDTSFNQPLNSWNVSRVTNMNGMFYADTSFNQPLDSWNVSQAIEMSYMFGYATNFNQPLESWNVLQVTDMSGMFDNAISFNQPLNAWNVSNVNNMRNMFAGISLSISNYNKLLLGWSSLPKLQHNVVFNAGNSQYSGSAQNAREKLIKEFDWTIMDGGISESSYLMSLGMTGLFFIVITAVIEISAYIAIAYLEYRKAKAKDYNKNLKFLIYLKNTFMFKRKKTVAKESLKDETFDKIKQIIDENKE